VIRWLLVLPAALIAFVGVQIVIIIGGFLSDNKLPNWAYQLVNSAASGYALVVAAAWMAPRGKLATAVVFGVLNIVLIAWVTTLGVSASGQQSDSWLLLVVAALLSAAGSVAGCYQTWESQGKGRVAEVT
jgi:hypothetical protein